MQYEVEQKFPVADFDAVERRLRELGASIETRFEQVDRYYAHPARDFRVTDEAFRLRSTGDINCITYKGPKIDPTTKTRRELEIPLPAGPAYREQFDAMLQALGFRAVREVSKVRRKAYVPWEGTRVEVSLDEVRNLGTFVELELTATEAELPAMRARLASLATRLGLSQTERRSYLSLLEERDQQGSTAADRS